MRDSESQSEHKFIGVIAADGKSMFTGGTLIAYNAADILPVN
jgi:hypothetical protein